jgi:hypothetical protein
MSNWKGFAAVAACAALACAGLVRAEAAPPLLQQREQAFSLAQPVYLADEAPRRPLMMALDQMGAAKTLDNWGVNIFGHAEASWTYSASSPPNNIITGRVFDFEHEDPTLNQLDLTIQRAIDASKGQFDAGFTLETLYGGDVRLIHANGMNFYGPTGKVPPPKSAPGYFQADPDEQIDFVQAYVDLAIPIGTGMEVKAGKMVTHMGYETINPTTNLLYSHSYSFGFAIPFTHTGVMASYNVDDKLSVMGGFSRGWNQALKDNNDDSLDALGQVSYKATDTTTLTFNATIGPEAAGDSGNWWWVGNFILSQKVGDQLTVALDTVYGLYNHGDPAGNGKSAQWYGAAGYASYVINDMLTLNGRAEWYDDQDGYTLTGVPNSVYEVTAGVSVKPMPNDSIGKNLMIRPEVRYDYADKAFFDGGTGHGQFTFGVDAIFMF